jgi:hypothetical protein
MQEFQIGGTSGCLGGKDARMVHSENKLLIVALILTFALAVAAFGMVLFDW